jgi:hypothetical protein
MLLARHGKDIELFPEKMMPFLPLAPKWFGTSYVCTSYVLP